LLVALLGAAAALPTLVFGRVAQLPTVVPLVVLALLTSWLLAFPGILPRLQRAMPATRALLWYVTSPADRIALLLEGRRFRDAAEEARSWLAMAPEPQWADGLALLSEALDRAGDVRAARDAAELAVRIAPHHAAAWGALGELALLERQHALAVQCLRRADERADGMLFPPARAQLWRISLALALARCDRREEARRVIARLRPTTARNNGDVLLHRRIAEVRCALEANARQPDSPHA
jgi:tetratricopeptide (TPR) repeat protein